MHDLRLLPRQHNFLLLGAGPTSDPGATSSIGGDGGVGGASREGRDGGGSASDRLRQRVLGYVPAALHYARWGIALPCCPALGAAALHASGTQNSS